MHGRDQDVCAKQAMQELKGKLPIERARMRLRLQLPGSCREELMAMLAQRQASVESQDLDMQTTQVLPSSPMLCVFFLHFIITLPHQRVLASTG